MLKEYLEAYRTKSSLGVQPASVMSDLENRLAEIFSAQLGPGHEVVETGMVSATIAQIGMPDGTAYTEATACSHDYKYQQSACRKLYRDPDRRTLGGVCAGFGHYFNVDVVFIRVVFVILFFIGFIGIIAYMALWIIMPAARNPKEKCEMRGLPLTPENISKFSI